MSAGSCCSSNGGCQTTKRSVAYNPTLPRCYPAEEREEIKGEDRFPQLSTGPAGTFDVLFMGTGVSIAVPNMGHVLEGKCKVCMYVGTDVCMYVDG